MLKGASPTTPRPPRLLTVGVMAEELGVPIHRVEYILSTRQIRPLALANRTRLFDREAKELVALELDAIGRRGGSNAR